MELITSFNDCLDMLKNSSTYCQLILLQIVSLMLSRLSDFMMNATEILIRTGNSQELIDGLDQPSKAMDRDESLAKIEIGTLLCIFFTTVLGNGTVLWALWTRKR